MKKNRVIEQTAHTMYRQVSGVVKVSRNHAYTAINAELLKLYWNIGKDITELQKTINDAKDMEKLLKIFSGKMMREYPVTFTLENIKNMKKFYLTYPEFEKIACELSWLHYLEIFKLEKEEQKEFYIKHCIKSSWSVKELQKQIDSFLYERVNLSRNKKKTLEISKMGQVVRRGKDLLKDKTITELLKL